MKIEYLGRSSFLLKGKEMTVLTDPYDSDFVGFKFPKVEPQIITVSHSHKDHNAVSQITSEKMVFDFPGEYENKGVRIYGYQTYHDKTNGTEKGENIIFKIIIDGVVILHCGDLGHIPDDSLIEQIKDTDVLLVPTGGKYTISAKEAAKLTEIIKPEVVIPMHFSEPKLSTELANGLSPATDFLKILGKENLVPVTKYSITADNLPEKEVILMSR